MFLMIENALSLLKIEGHSNQIEQTQTVMLFTDGQISCRFIIQIELMDLRPIFIWIGANSISISFSRQTT